MFCQGFGISLLYDFNFALISTESILGTKQIMNEWNGEHTTILTIEEELMSWK